MKCSKCGGEVINLTHCVFYIDGSTSGEHWCQGCGARKPWFIKGLSNPEEVINMETNNDEKI